MSTWIERFDDTTGAGTRVAVKDLIDMEGLPTTAGCKAVAEQAKPADRDAACLAGIRRAEREGRARIVGKVNLHELALGATGINPWFGTPTNPLDPTRVPGGSSSGSAAAVGSDEADVALGSDTGGSVRIPSACCGTAGLKTTWGRIGLDGVYLLSGSMDTIGPMARDVRGLVTGMQLLEPGFSVDPVAPRTVGRLRLPDVDPRIDEAIDRALAAAGFEVEDVEVPGWHTTAAAASPILLAEAWAVDGALLEAHPDQIGENVAALLRAGSGLTDEMLAEARKAKGAWQAELAKVFERVELLAAATIPIFPPTVEDADDFTLARLTLPVNVAGVPALALPVAAPGAVDGERIPPSVQLIGPSNSEERLLAAGLRLEGAVGT